MNTSASKITIWIGSVLSGCSLTVASHIRVSNPLFTHKLFPIYIAVFIWLGLYLRDARVKAVIS